MPSHRTTPFPTEGPPVTYGGLRREEKWMGMSEKGSRCYNSTVNEPDVPHRPSVRVSHVVCHATGKNDTWTPTPCSLIYCPMSSKALGDPLITRLSFSFFFHLSHPPVLSTLLLFSGAGNDNLLFFAFKRMWCLWCSNVIAREQEVIVTIISSLAPSSYWHPVYESIPAADAGEAHKQAQKSENFFFVSF